MGIKDCFCVLNFCCLGRVLGRQVINSESVREDHAVWSDAGVLQSRDMFRNLGISARAVERLFDIFAKIDADGSGEVDLNEFLHFFSLHKSRFALRAFAVLDSDGSGEIDFIEFILGLWNFCAADNLSLVRFAFDLYDADSSGELEENEVLRILKDLYGKRGYKNNTHAQKVFSHLQSMDINGDSKDFCINFKNFYNFSKSHPALLYPAFKMQQQLRESVLGTGFWQEMAKKRRILEGKMNSEDGDAQSLLEKLMEYSDDTVADHFEEEIKFRKEYKPPKKTVSSSLKDRMKRSVRPDSEQKTGYEIVKKEEIKSRIKKELRAARKATVRGKDPEIARIKARDSFKKEKKKELKRKQASKYIQKERSSGSAAKWLCKGCGHSNHNPWGKCDICGRPVS